MRIAPALLLATAVLALAGCQSEKVDSNAKAAGGEILPGTISDAMIDLDRSTATPPLAPATAAKGDAGQKAKDKAEEASPAANATASSVAADATDEKKPSATPKTAD